MTMKSFADRAAGSDRIMTLELSSLPTPPKDLLDEARTAALTVEEHDRLAGQLRALSAVEVVRIAAADPMDAATPLRIAAWNAERLKYHAPSVALVRDSDADILLLTETDLGMARAGNRHTTADLARDLGMSYVYGVEFVELGLGDGREREWHRNETNAIGFHGNALLSRLPIEEAALVKLDDGGVWWTDARDGQGRLGSRMALVARITSATGPIIAVSVHLESKSNRDDRASQIDRLLTAVNLLAGDLPVVIGGDLNTNDVRPGSPTPEADEPLFALMAAAGYRWDEANDFAISQRTRPDGTPEPPFTRIDWLFCRGLNATDARTIAATDAEGNAISDHELVIAKFSQA